MAKDRGGESRDASGSTGTPAPPKPRPPPAVTAPARPTMPPVAKPPAAPQARDIGIDVPKPTRSCEDVHCPFHGTLPVRGQSFEGKVVSTRMQRSVVVERQYTRFIRKYER